MDNEIDEMDYEYQEEITCPYCGDKNIDSWEVGKGINEGDLGEQECDNCGKKFIVERHLRITYSSEKAPCLNNEGEHDFEKMIGVPKEYYVRRYRCKICGKEINK